VSVPSKKKRLGGWTRLAIVASVLWALGSGFYTINDIAIDEGRLRSAEYSFVFATCSNEQTAEQTIRAKNRNCGEEAWAAWSRPAKLSRWPALIVALGPLPFVWLFGWVIFLTARWVRAGFHHD
jgi:hypothetical protein